MSALRAAVHVAEPIPVQKPDGTGSAGLWSPISCTLIYADKEAVLVDTPITTQQTQILIKWIEDTAPNRTLSYIYITHGHGDHWFGIPLILQRWPNAVPIATPGTISHMKDTVEGPAWERWNAMFPDQICTSFTFAQPLDKSNEFQLERRHTMRAVECGHSDTYDSTVLWVPELRLVVCGDVVYGDCHQMLAFANTREKRKEWVEAVEIVEALDPLYVVPGHKRKDEIDGVWHLANTKRYIEDWGKMMAADPKTPEEIFDAVVKMYPHRLNYLPINFSAAAQSMREENCFICSPELNAAQLTVPKAEKDHKLPNVEPWSPDWMQDVMAYGC